MFHVKHFFDFFFFVFLLREILISVCTNTHIHRCGIDLTGLRPFKLPHTRGDPLVNPPEGLCGAGDSATHDYDNLVDYLSRDKGRSGLYFSPYYKIQFCSIQPKPQIWAKAQVVKRLSRGINSPISCSELSPRNTGSAGPSGSHEGPPSCGRGCKGEGNALPFDY